MKRTKIFTFSIFIMLLSFNSCIKEEALNKEADILKIAISEGGLTREPIISNSEVICYINEDANLKNISLFFKLTEGATIFPQGGVPMDFSEPRVYTVYSEDKQWSKEYIITFIQTSSSPSSKYTFNNFDIKDEKYYEIYETTDGTKSLIWASGNVGFSITAGNKSPEEYPTSVEKTDIKGLLQN